MNTINQMKNMVVLRNLPSNIIEEAFVILKPNKKVRIINTKEDTEEKSGDYIIKEAEMIITNYITDVDKENRIKNNTIKQIEHKYKKLKKINTVISILFAITIIFGILVKWKYKYVLKPLFWE